MKKNQFNFLYILLLFICWSSCQKEELIPSVVDEVVFDCPDEKTDFFFEGEMGGVPFCYYEGVNDYEMRFTTTASLLTVSNTFEVGPDSLGGSGVLESAKWINWGFRPESIFDLDNPDIHGQFPHATPWLYIQSPAASLDTNNTKIIHKNVHSIGPLKLQSDQLLSDQGFNIVLQFSDWDSGRLRKFEARGGDQTDSFLRITELDIRDLPDGIAQYTVTFEFACNLYYKGEAHRFYNRIENGRMRVQFEIKK